MWERGCFYNSAFNKIFKWPHNYRMNQLVNQSSFLSYSHPVYGYSLPPYFSLFLPVPFLFVPHPASSFFFLTLPPWSSLALPIPSSFSNPFSHSCSLLVSLSHSPNLIFRWIFCFSDHKTPTSRQPRKMTFGMQALFNYKKYPKQIWVI